MYAYLKACCFLAQHLLALLLISFVGAVIYWRLRRRKQKRDDPFDESTLDRIAAVLTDIEEFASLFRRYFSKVRPLLRRLFFGCLLTFVSCELVAKAVLHESSFTIRFVDVASRMSVAYVSAFIFYFLVVHWQRQSDKENIQDHIGPLIYDIITLTENMVEPLIEEIDTEDRPNDVLRLTRSDLSSALKHFDDPSHELNVSINGEPATIASLVHYSVEETKKKINEIFVHYPLLDGELIGALNLLTTSGLFTWPDLSTVSCRPSYLDEPLWSYLKRMEPLRHYHNSFPGKSIRFPSSEEIYSREQEHLHSVGGRLQSHEIKPIRNPRWKRYLWLKKHRSKHRTNPSALNV